MWWPCSTQFSSVSALLCASLFNLSRARSLPQLIKAWMKTTLTCEFERTVLIKGADIQSRTQICGCFSLRNAVCLIWSIKHLSSGFSLVRKWVRCRGFKFKSKDHSATVYYGTTPTETMFRCCSWFYFLHCWSMSLKNNHSCLHPLTHMQIHTKCLTHTNTHTHTHTHTHIATITRQQMQFPMHWKLSASTLTSNTSSYLSGSELKTTPLEKPCARVAVLLLFFRVIFLPQQLLNLWDVPGN